MSDPMEDYEDDMELYEQEQLKKDENPEWEKLKLYTVVTRFATFTSQVISATSAEDAEKKAKDLCESCGESGEVVGEDYDIYSVDINEQGGMV